MATTHGFLLLLLLAAAAALSVVAVFDDPNSEVHAMLPQFGLPKGLLPDSVVGYTLTADGEFTLELAAPCYVQFSYLVHYDKNIRGKVSYGLISDLSGIQAQKFFIWGSLNSIVAHPAAGNLEFKVAFISVTLSVSEFQSIPTCMANVGSCSGGGGDGCALEELPAVSEA